MADYWLSTKSRPDIFRPAYQNAENDKVIRETVGIDSALVANDLGINTFQVQAYQRKLGVRKITGNSPRRSKTDRRLARTED